MDRVTILGSANAVPKIGQDNTHLLIETGTSTVMVDCGDNPVAKVAAAGSHINKVNDLILTHFHADHVGSLPLLIMDMWLEKRETPLTIHGLEVTLNKAKSLLELFNWQDWKGMFQVNFSVIPDEGKKDFITGDLFISALPVLHLVPTIGLRMDFNGKRIVAYSCDTEPCENLMKLANQADALLQEAAGNSKGHTSPAQAGELAAKAGVKKLVLIHYDNRIDEELLLADARVEFKGEVVLAKDMMQV
ncbi:MAG TPA: MBL fold metallo-hydrolase [Anaerolineaceae bacterium]|nr:MBL fold metallo-hydrolase [Anaerolineaceae bacterium]